MTLAGANPASAETHSAIQEPTTDGRGTTGQTLAIIPWGFVVEDFLDRNGLTLADFCRETTSGWMFGYVDALRAAGVRTVIVGMSREEHVVRTIHRPTGTEIRLLPVPRAYRGLRAKMGDPMQRTVAQGYRRPFAVLAREALPFIATPVGLLARELKRDHCDAILCQEYEFPRFDVCVLIARVLRLPVFATFQGGDYQRWRIERATRPLAMRFARGFVIGSSVEASRVRERYSVPAERIAGIPNPIDLETWRPGDRLQARQKLGIAADARVVAWHGRIDLWQKGLDVLADAWERVCRGRAGVDLTLLLVGGGPDVEDLRARLKCHDVGNVVWIDHYVYEPSVIAGLLAAADVYAFASRHEGFPVALLEAMACGLPVITTDVGGIRDVFVEREQSGGVLVPPEDADQFAVELGHLIDSPGSRRQMGERARRRAEDFGAGRVGEQLRDFIFGRPPESPSHHA
jgi:glycosyltransferase involved in cell wall biosynthesis